MTFPGSRGSAGAPKNVRRIMFYGRCLVNLQVICSPKARAGLEATPAPHAPSL